MTQHLYLEILRPPFLIFGCPSPPYFSKFRHSRRYTWPTEILENIRRYALPRSSLRVIMTIVTSICSSSKGTTSRVGIDGMLWKCVIITWNGLKGIKKMDLVISIKTELGFSKIQQALKFGNNLVISKVKKCSQCHLGKRKFPYYVIVMPQNYLFLFLFSPILSNYSFPLCFLSLDFSF